MGKIKSGILGGFQGTVGTVVGSSWKGIDYMRSKSHNVTNPRTELQQMQRGKMALTAQTLRPLLGYLRIGFKNEAVRKSAYNAAFSYTIRNAISGNFPDYEIDYSKMLVARGTLESAENIAVSAADGAFTFTWDDNSGLFTAKATDIAMPLVWNTTKKLAIYGTNPASRAEGSTTMTVPKSWATDSCVLYLAFVSVDGEKVSDSLYLGEEVAV